MKLWYFGVKYSQVTMVNSHPPLWKCQIHNKFSQTFPPSFITCSMGCITCWAWLVMFCTLFRCVIYNRFPTNKLILETHTFKAYLQKNKRGRERKDQNFFDLQVCVIAIFHLDSLQIFVCIQDSFCVPPMKGSRTGF